VLPPITGDGKTDLEFLKEDAKVISQYENNILMTQQAGDNLLTVQRRTSFLGKAGCLASLEILDVLHFDKDGKLEKHEFFSDKGIEFALAEVTCNPIFSPEKVRQIISDQHNGQWVDWGDNLDVLWTDDFHLVNPPLPPGKANMVAFIKTIPIKKIAFTCNNIFVTGNTAMVIRHVQILSTDDCLYSFEDVVKMTLHYPDGKISSFEYISTNDGNKERCGASNPKDQL